MTLHLKAKESVGAGVTRVLRNELEWVVDLACAKVRRVSELEAVHEIRKSFKKVRAVLRLVREGLGEDRYRDENRFFRDAARPLTEVRDAEVLVETFAELVRQFGDTMDAGAVKRVEAALLANRACVTRRVLDEDRSLAAVEVATSHALTRVLDWQLGGDGWASLEPGLRRVYRAGHRALSGATEDPSVENFHEWREQVKYHWHQLQLLEPTWSAFEHDLGDRVHQLSQLLGNDHDLAVLRQRLVADPLTHAGHHTEGLSRLVDRRREELERRAFALGQHLYRDSPRDFSRRIEAYWNGWMTRRGLAHRGAATEA